MRGDLARRLSEAEDRAKALPRKPGVVTPEQWLKYAALQCCVLLDTFPTSAPTLFEQLYQAIDMGNKSGDDAGEYRASLRKRFDWAVYHASRVRLGTGMAGRWHKIEIVDPDADAWFDQFLAELPERHPELIGLPPGGLELKD